MTANELRRKYLDFFISKGHVEIPSASLVPENDPSVLFTTAGMHPLVPYLLGERHPHGDRLVDYQKCVRTGDIDEVGDNTHLTFFEMLGNWSLGDYFKQDSIKWSFDFLTFPEWLGIDKKKLSVSVFEGDQNTPFDQESYSRWLELGIAPKRIAKLGKNDNWWPAGGENVGPQGPDTEIFYWSGKDDVPKIFDPSDKRWVEIWNNVFMQFYRDTDGKVSELKKKNVDTGMGLERTLAVLQGKESVYETELFLPIIKKIENVTGASYYAHTREMRIIADHVRTSIMLIADGVLPTNKDQGYVLRRLIRRAARFLVVLNAHSGTSKDVANACIETLAEAYPDLESKRNKIIEEILNEELKFDKTLAIGQPVVEKMFINGNIISGEDAFLLYASFGFPLELTEEIAREHGQEVNRVVFEAEFKKHQDLSRAGAGQKFAGGLADYSEQTTKLHTATHLLHKALRMVLGNHVEQKGSNITTERLRFDFCYNEKMTPKQIVQVENIVNEQIQKDLQIKYSMMTVAEAKQFGAIGLFEDKYATLGEKIKVYQIGEGADRFSVEICGGPHIERTGTLGIFKIIKEEASSAGVRRIKAIII